MQLAERIILFRYGVSSSSLVEFLYEAWNLLGNSKGFTKLEDFDI